MGWMAPGMVGWACKDAGTYLEDGGAVLDIVGLVLLVVRWVLGPMALGHVVHHLKACNISRWHAASGKHPSGRL